MKIAIIAINREGQKLAKRLKPDFSNAKIFTIRMSRKGALKDLTARIFNEYEGLIFICTLGITVRSINGLIRNKLIDPAVVCADTAGRFAISVLSGHEGGANALAFQVAASLDAFPVITTGKEVHKKIILGIGMRKGIDSKKVEYAIKAATKNKGIEIDVVRVAATADLKKGEKGLIKACRNLGLPLLFIPRQAIKNFNAGLPVSDVAERHLGLSGVAEPCALLAGRSAKLILKKEIYDGVTVALAKEE